jgi:hypothetical protein
MQIQRVGRSDPEKIYLQYRNMSGDTINNNAALVMDLGTTIDGISCVAPATASLLGWIGISDSNVGDTGYGRAQCWGYRDSILLSHEGTSVTIGAGEALHLVNGQFGLTTSTVQALSTCGFKYCISGEASDISAAAYIDGIIRCI